MNAVLKPPSRTARRHADSRRALLNAVAQRFLDAVQAHDLQRAPLAANVRVTRNGVQVGIQAADWEHITTFVSRQCFVDTTSAQIMVTGAVDCSGVLYPYGIRLALVDELITEVEVMISSSNHGHFADVDRLLTPDVLYDAPVPVERGAGSRARLRKAGDSYWVALNESDGSLAHFNHRCDRYANGKKITNSLALLLSPDAAVHTPASLITATRAARPHVVERRFPILDVELGVCGSIAIVEFRKNAERPDAGAFYIFSVVKIVDDEIRNVDHLHVILAAGTGSGWG
ncbi:hypothetical protein [Paraburkholderia sp. J67]|uniref:hypothetical protein n=1 Tax=Paraburkholderia sp. J67 TaxID=2805435 RepID=UPI002ABE09B9|nr:hypothetical protein [Paraburkholderia sp. J67]